MDNKKDAFYFFISLTRGNWRNAMFIECSKKCSSNCKGFLMISDTEGVPMFYPVTLFEEKSKQIIDKNECAAVVSIHAFESIFDRWLLWNVADKHKCPFPQVMSNTGYIL